MPNFKEGATSGEPDAEDATKEAIAPDALPFVIFRIPFPRSMNLTDDNSKPPITPSAAGGITEEDQEWERKALAQMRAGATWKSSRKQVRERVNQIRAARGLPPEGPPSNACEASPGLTGSASARRPAGSAALEWARSRGLILDPAPLNAAFESAEKICGGMEHNVFLDVPTRRMIKIAQDGFFGMHNPLDFGKYLDRWALSNTEFGDQSLFHGFVHMPGESFYSVVVSQPFVEGREGKDIPPVRDAIRAFMRNKGYFADGRGGSFTNPKKNLRVTDTKAANFIVRDDGTVFPIDVNIESLAAQADTPGQPELFAGETEG